MTSRPAQAIRRLRENARRRATVRDARKSERETLQHERELETLEWRERIARQWSGSRSRAEDTPEPVVGGETNLAKGKVPYGVDLAAQWSWRFLVIAASTWVILWLLDYFLVVVLPLAIALLITALAAPLVNRLQRIGLPRALSAMLVVVVGLGLVGLALTFIGSQVRQGFSDLSGQVVDGLEQIRDWLENGPLNASDSQIDTWIAEAQAQITSSSDQVVTTATELGTTLGHVVAGIFIVLFATYFFLADGAKIWAWIVRIFPRVARLRADSSGRVAWRSLTQFVRATVLVAAVDAIGIMIVATILGLPLVSAIGILVFLGAFIPMVGATISGAVAVLVALVDQGPVVALIMLGGVILVQQIEAHVLQPFLMGRFVSVHPLGVIVAIAMGVLVAGIAGALIAVPLVASVNAVVQHLAAYTEVGEDPEISAARDPDVAEDVAESES